MRIGVLFGQLNSQRRKFNRSERGNVLITFALAAIPMLGVVGAAIDYSRGNSARAAMQVAGDSAALILSKTAQGMTAEQLNTKATELFNALLKRPDVINLAVNATLSAPGTSSFQLNFAVTGQMPTAFTRFVGQEYINLGTGSEVVWGVKRLELALALDVTGSMASNNKMTELKTAAKSLLTTLKGAAKKDGDIRVAIAPFAVNVNVGATNVASTALDWSNWSSEPAIMAPTAWLQSQGNQSIWERSGPGARCPFTTTDHGFGCTNGPASKSNETTVNTIPSSGTYSGLICPARDDGSKSTTATGLLSGRYHSGCYYTPTGNVRPESEWHPVRTGSGASCGGLPFDQCQCSGNGSNRVCAFRPESNWQAYAQGSSMSCGNLSTSNPEVCKCFGSDSSKVCKQKTYYTNTRVWRPRPKTAWDGCVRDRNQDFDTQNVPATFGWSAVSKTNIDGVSETYPSADTPATGSAVQPYQHVNCPAAMISLTSNWAALEAKVDELQPTGNTNVTIGLAWAFNAVSQSAPLSNATAPSADLDKVIILLTDGDNTQNRWTNSQSDIDARTSLACANVKAANIKLYTIRVINGNASLLQGCATKPDMYYDVQNASDLNKVFTTIAQNLANLRIAK